MTISIEDYIQKGIEDLGNMIAFPGQIFGSVYDPSVEDTEQRDATLDEFMSSTYIDDKWPKLKERVVRLLLTGNPDGKK